MKTNKAKILFRTSGGRANFKELGFGHIYRTLNLSKALSDQKIFFLVEDYGGVKPLLNKKIKNISFLRKNISVKSDISQTSDFIKKNNIDITIVDKYNVSGIFLQKIRKFSKVVYISDLLNINYTCDLMVNGFVGYKNSRTKNIDGTKFLLGPSYQILNDNFSRKKRIKKKYDLLVTFGGFDEKKIIEKIFEQLIKISDDKKIKIILGPGSATKYFSRLFKKQLKKITVVKTSNNMYRDISMSKYGICSGGLTTYEFASQKIPFLVICQATHQLKTANMWEKLGYAKNLGMINRKTTDKIIDEIKKLSKIHIVSKNKNIIDGLGSKRVSKEILKLYDNKNNN